MGVLSSGLDSASVKTLSDSLGRTYAAHRGFCRTAENTLWKKAPGTAGVSGVPAGKTREQAGVPRKQTAETPGND
jgi:hypothetical protein